MASIDGLRGLAALSVFAFHAWLYTMSRPTASQRDSLADYAANELRVGLVLFFVLSGFLLSRPWFAAALEERRPPDLRRYLRSRVARIAPAYYVALVGSIGLLWGLAGTPGLRLPPASDLPLYFLFAQNTSPSSVMKLNPPMWSLAVEVGFYALLPVIGLLATKLAPRRRAQALVPLALLALGVAWNVALAGRGLGMTYSKTLAAMLPYFAIGMLAALALYRRTPSARARRTMIAAGVLLVVCDAVAKTAVPASGSSTRTCSSPSSATACRPSASRSSSPRRLRRPTGGCSATGSSPASARSPTASISGTSRCSCSCAATACCRWTSCSASPWRCRWRWPCRP